MGAGEDIAADVPQDMRAVLIEDDERLARLTTRYLESHGVVVSWFGDGRTGLREALRNRPDVVLLDLQLPELDGIRVCRELRTADIADAIPAPITPSPM